MRDEGASMKRMDGNAPACHDSDEAWPSKASKHILKIDATR
jgi:hypothetical protein